MTTEPLPARTPPLLPSIISPPSGTTNAIPNASNIHSTTAIFIVVLVTAFFFVIFFVIYIRNNHLFHFPSPGPAQVITQHSTHGSGHHNGLEASTLETLPTFVYSEVKGRKIGKETLECAICLSEFSDDEVLRLLPSCSHVYHVDCIDIWLETHVTCPICRTNLAAVDFGGSASVEHVAIVVQNDGGLEEAVVAPVGDVKEAVELETPAVRFSRWHTIGHSAAPVWDCYTLRLPEHVRGEIMAAGKIRREESTVAPPVGREVSGRRGFRVSQSERWAPSFLARALSIKLPAWPAAAKVRIGEGAGVVQTAEASFGRLGSSGRGGGGGRMESGDEDSEASTVALARVRPSADEV